MLLPGSLLDIHQFAEANKEAVLLTGKEPATVAQLFLVLQKLHLKQIPSYLQRHSKKQLVS